jgi:D-glycero-D-manno-heptose 1,7-bisphosphate phosphatase
MAMSAMRAAVFLDKDGTVVVDEPYNADPARMCLTLNAAQGLRRLAQLRVPLIVISNQPGVALGRFEARALAAVERRLRELFTSCGAHLTGFYYCPHHPEGSVARFSVECDCRKPLPGLLRRAARDHGIDLERSWMVGDILDDVEAGNRAGCRTIMLNNGNETQWLRTAATRWLRTAHAMVADLDAGATFIVSRSADLYEDIEVPEAVLRDDA